MKVKNNAWKRFPNKIVTVVIIMNSNFLIYVSPLEHLPGISVGINRNISLSLWRQTMVNFETM